MRISAKVEYALRALIMLGWNHGRTIPMAEIAEVTLVPLRYLGKILLDLKKCGIVKSKRGMQGGYQLRLSPHEIQIGDVIRKLEGPLTAGEYDKEYGFKPLSELIANSVAEILNKTTISDLLEGAYDHEVQRTKHYN